MTERILLLKAPLSLVQINSPPPTHINKYTHWKTLFFFLKKKKEIEETLKRSLS
jgi:hypothetical protein